MRHELVEREDVGEGSLDDDVATSVTLHFTKQDPVAMWLRSTASCKNGLLCSAEQKNDNEAVERVLPKKAFDCKELQKKWRSPKMDLCAEGGQRSDSYLR